MNCKRCDYVDSGQDLRYESLKLAIELCVKGDCTVAAIPGMAASIYLYLDNGTAMDWTE